MAPPSKLKKKRSLSLSSDDDEPTIARSEKTNNNEKKIVIKRNHNTKNTNQKNNIKKVQQKSSPSSGRSSFSFLKHRHFLIDEDRLKIESIIKNSIERNGKKDDISEIINVFENELNLLYVETQLIEQCFKVIDDQQPQQKKTSSKNRELQQQKQKQQQQLLLEELAIRLHIQTKKAEMIFTLLDIDHKGVIVIQDIQRAADDILSNDDDHISYDDIIEMIDMFDDNNGNDGLLYLNDIIRIARTVNL